MPIAIRMHEYGAPEVLRAGEAVITMMQKLGGIHGTRPGGYQELVRVPASTLARIPSGIDARTMGALGLPAVTAWCALEALEVRAGMRVLVHAGSSAVGTIALQLLRARGIDSVATGTRKEKFPLIESCGAAIVVSSKDADWPKKPGEIDRVFDLVGQATFAASVSLLRAHGKLVFVGGSSGGELSFSGWDLMRPTTLTGWSSESLTRDDLQRAVDAVAAESIAGRLRVAELNVFPLRDAAAAHTAMEARTLAGRVVLDPHA